MDSFNKKAVLLALRKTNIDYNCEKPNDLRTVTKIRCIIEKEKYRGKMMVRIRSFDKYGGRDTDEFGYYPEIYEFDTYRKGIIGIFIDNYLYFSIKTPPIIYHLIKYFNDYIFDTYKYKCKDIVKFICEKMLKIILKEIADLRRQKYQEVSDNFGEPTFLEIISNTSKRISTEIFIENVFELLEFDTSFELIIDKNIEK